MDEGVVLMKLSQRIRPDVEAAPWVVAEVKQLEEYNEKLYNAMKRLVRLYVVSDDSWDIEESVNKAMVRLLD